VVSELPLPRDDAADLVALGAEGTLWIVEISLRLLISRRPEMDGLPAALRPAVLRHHDGGAVRYLPPTTG